MLSFTLEDALIDNPDTKGYYLYLYRDGDVVFYVGQSKDPIERIRQHLGRALPYWPDAIGQLILDNAPASFIEWKIDLFTLSDCLEAVQAHWVSQASSFQNLVNTFYDPDLVNRAEEALIAHYRPHLNVLNATKYTNPLPERYVSKRIVSIPMPGQRSPQDLRRENFHRWLFPFTRLLEPPQGRFVVVLLGLPGSGKTALVQDWLQSFQWLQSYRKQENFLKYVPILEQETPFRFCKRMLQERGTELHVSDVSHGMPELGKQLRAASIRFLLLDQAERCSPLLLSCLRVYLYEQWGISLLFIGKMQFAKKLSRDEALNAIILSHQKIEALDEKSE